MQHTDHLVAQLRGGRTLRWVAAVIGAYNVFVAAETGSWVRLAVWVVLTAWVLALQVVPWRVGTRVEADGVRALVGWWTRPLVPWAAVTGVRVQGPYDSESTVVVSGRSRPAPLRGMAPADVRALAAAHHLSLDDPARERQDAAAARSAPRPAADLPAPATPSLEPDDPMDGPFRTSRP